jgi:cellulose synthase/poly-beta-1,6-N-acetylglucosamine synthase-like glycosyltransferase
MQSSDAGGGRGAQRGEDVAHGEGSALAGHAPARASRQTAHPDVDEWQSVLARLAIDREVAIEIAALARQSGEDFASCLLASDAARRVDLTRAIAADLGLKASIGIDPKRLIAGDEQLLTLLRGGGDNLPVKLLEKDGSVSFLIPTRRIRLGWMRDYIRSHPDLTQHLRIADTDELRAAVTERARPLLARVAVSGLSDRFPQMSARVVANGWQGTVLGIAITVLPVGFALAPELTLGLLHGLATFFFFACVALRFAAVSSVTTGKRLNRIEAPPANAPVYSVLVALYKEADIVPNLLTALDWIVWPRDRLEIKLVCEADDAETLAAINTQQLPSHIKVVEVPATGPRTKPKALAYALPMTSGEFVALYDAEDWPDPMQLAEAWQRFRASGPELAVLQAPLVISNPGESLIARMFAFEYSALFHGLLPWLSRHGLMLPLGGTSNHFRRAALEAVGGWDPFNVTEDADLGTRLARFGYQAETISAPTYEQAPTRLSVWLPQRTRWFKGWAQTWLVHMRDPVKLAGDLGPRSFVIAQVLFAGMLASSLLHPLLLATFCFGLAQLLLTASSGPAHSALLIVDVINITCGYLSFLLLGWQTLAKNQRRGFWKIVALTPIYWAMMSYAGWRAVLQLWRRPFHWEKTPHKQVQAAPAGVVPAPAIGA